MDHALQFDMLHPIVAIKLTDLHSLQVSCNLTSVFSVFSVFELLSFKFPRKILGRVLGGASGRLQAR